MPPEAALPTMKMSPPSKGDSVLAEDARGMSL